MASNPITSWQIEGKKVEVVTYFLLLGSKITADGDYSHETGRLLLGRKAMTNLASSLAWKMPWTEEPGRLQSMGLPRVGHD